MIKLKNSEYHLAKYHFFLMNSNLAIGHHMFNKILFNLLLIKIHYFQDF